jgi:hypothetical protein
MRLGRCIPRVKLRFSIPSSGQNHVFVLEDASDDERSLWP